MKQALIPLLLVATIWCVSLYKQLPLPHADDLFFTGAAINLAKGGPLVNPYLETWNAATKTGKYYYQPPFQAFLLASWLKVFGISSASIIAFQYTCYGLFTLFALAICHEHHLTRIATVIIVTSFACWMAKNGLRSEALGLTFLAAGYWFLRRERVMCTLLGFVFWGAAVSTSPSLVTYVLPLTLAVSVCQYTSLRQKGMSGRRILVTQFLTLAAAVAIIGLLFSVCIDFDYGGFVSDFLLHISWRRIYLAGVPSHPVVQGLLHGYWLILYVPIYLSLLALVAAFVAWGPRPGDRTALIMTTGLLAGVVFNLFLYPTQSSALSCATFFSVVTLGILISAFKDSRHYFLLAAALAIVIAASQFLTVLEVASIGSSHNTPYQAIRTEAQASPERRYAIDSAAARYVFQYDLPPHTVSWDFDMPPPGTSWPTAMNDRRADTTWIVSKSHLGMFVSDAEDFPRIFCFGRRFRSLAKDPYDIVVVP